MPVNAAGARNQFLATMAKIARQGHVDESSVMEQVAAETALEIAQQNPGIDSAELLASLPDAWLNQPGGHTTRSQMEAFLKVAGPVLGVDDGVVSPLATRGVASARDVDAAITVNQARQAAANPSPALQQAIDVAAASPRDVMEALEGAFQDAGFLASLGGDRMKHLLREAAREMAGALSNARPVDPDAPVVLAGGRPVSGPDVQRAAQERPHGSFRRTATSNMPVQLLATVTAELVAIRAGVDEAELRNAVAGREVNLISGRGPSPDSMPLHVVLNDDGTVDFGIGLDVAELRRFAAVDGGADEDVVKSVGAQLRTEDVELQKYLDAELPMGFFLDARAQKTQTVQEALAGD